MMAVVLLPLALVFVQIGTAGAEPSVLYIARGLAQDEDTALRARIEEQTDWRLVDLAEAGAALRPLSNEGPTSDLDEALERARRAYIDLRFRDATRMYNELLERALASSSTAPPVDEIGAILFGRAITALADNRRADALFDMVLANTVFPALTPDADRHGPPVFRLYEDARAALGVRASGSLRVSPEPRDALVYLDGSPVAREQVVACPHGRHLLSAERFGYSAQSRWIECAGEVHELVALERASDAMVSAQVVAVLDAGQPLSREQALATARVLDLAHVVDVLGEDRSATLTVVEPHDGREWQQLHGERAQLERLAEGLHRTLSPLETVPDLDDDDGGAWYEQWYVWTIAGVIVAGAVITVVLLTSSQPDLTFNPPRRME